MPRAEARSWQQRRRSRVFVREGRSTAAFL